MIAVMNTAIKYAPREQKEMNRTKISSNIKIRELSNNYYTSKEKVFSQTVRLGQFKVQYTMSTWYPKRVHALSNILNLKREAKAFLRY